MHLRKTVVTLFCSLFFMLISVPVHAEASAEKVTKADKYEGIEIVVNINQAGVEELDTLLVGIGPSKALAIVEYRELHGPFSQLDDIVKVKGIGPAFIEKNKERILF